jgi:GNAT superfamily N-acetyltransferase
MLGVSGVSVNPPGGFSPAISGAFSPDDVGARVSVRYRAADALTDVVGDLDSLDADQLAIRRSDGSRLVVALASIAACRVVGPSPLSARELEAVSGRAVPVPDESWLGQWWLRAAPGLGARGNSARPLGDPGLPFDDALTAAAAWYSERALVPTVRAITGSRVDSELGERGWIADDLRSLQTATVASMRRRLGGVRPDSVQLSAQPSAAWLGRYREGTVPPTAASVLADVPEVAFAMIPAADSGAPGSPAIAIGRATVEAPWVGFAAIEVDPASRRRGYSRAVMAALVEWAAPRGAVRGYLEVMADNQPAIALYASLGFTEHYRYTYRTPPG